MRACRRTDARRSSRDEQEDRPTQPDQARRRDLLPARRERAADPLLVRDGRLEGRRAGARPLRSAQGYRPTAGPDPRVTDAARIREALPEEDTRHLAASTRSDLERSYLKARKDPEEGELVPADLGEDGLLMQHFGDVRLDEITAPRLREFWAQTIETPYKNAKGRNARGPLAPGRHYVNVLASVLEYARDLGLIDSMNAVEEFRRQLRRRSRTKGGRAAAAEDRIRPIERPDEVGRLLGAARVEGLAARVLVTALLDAGLRLGEALGLRWGAVAFGSGPEDVGRHLHIRESRPRGGDRSRRRAAATGRRALSPPARRAVELLRRPLRAGPGNARSSKGSTRRTSGIASGAGSSSAPRSGTAR